MRVDNWEVLLFQEIENSKNIEFEWSVHDCVTWAFDVRKLITGIDYSKKWKGKYKTRIASLKFLKKLGHDSLFSLACKELGQPKSPLLSQRGDIVLTCHDGAFGVCFGSQVATISTDGMKFITLNEIEFAWSV